MNAADRLIVALDGDAAEMGSVFLRLHRETPVRWFKIGPQLLLQHSGMPFIENMLREDDVNLFADMKVYDTRDTVKNVVARAFSLRARFVTVHATPSVMEAAMRAKPADERCKVLAVGPTTDQGDTSISSYAHEQVIRALKVCDGIVCHPKLAFHGRRDKKISICPGIRPSPPAFTKRPDYLMDGGHSYPQTPIVALKGGADYLVVGRPIWQAPDPIAAALAILAEMETAV